MGVFHDMEGSDMNDEKKQQSIKEAFLASMSQFLVIICAILFFFAIFKFHSILENLKGMCSILSPILLGVAFAYLIHPITTTIESL